MSSLPKQLISGVLPGPAGDLEYLWQPASDSAVCAAVVCHPDPMQGGTLHTRIVHHLARALWELGLPVLRFNFRGVGLSQGKHDKGRGEREDLRAAVVWLRARLPLPLALGGFSFGARVAIEFLADAPHPEIVRLIAVGTPLTRGPLPADWAWSGPKLFLSGDRDEFAARADLEAYVRRLAEPRQLIWFPEGDHFLNGRMPEFRARIQEAMARDTV